MANFFDPVKLDDESFKSLVSLADNLIASDQATLMTSDRLAYPWLHVFSEDTFEDHFAVLVVWLDAMVFFAFEYTPDDAILNWAEGFDPDLASLAVERVHFMRNAMPWLADLWSNRRASLIPTLDLPEYQVSKIPTSDIPHVDVLLPTSIRSSRNRPDAGSAQRTTLRLFPSDVAYLREWLENIEDELRDAVAEEHDLDEEDGSND
jgi:hypothetical protein